MGRLPHHFDFCLRPHQDGPPDANLSILRLESLRLSQQSSTTMSGYRTTTNLQDISQPRIHSGVWC